MYIYLYVQLQKKHAQIRNANEINGQNINKYLPTPPHSTIPIFSFCTYP